MLPLIGVDTNANKTVRITRPDSPTRHGMSGENSQENLVNRCRTGIRSVGPRSAGVPAGSPRRWSNLETFCQWGLLATATRVSATPMGADPPATGSFLCSSPRTIRTLRGASIPIATRFPEIRLMVTTMSSPIINCSPSFRLSTNIGLLP